MNFRHSKKLLSPLTAAVFLAFSSPAIAFEEEAKEERGNRIIVTANKRPVLLQDVATSVQTLTESSLEKLGIDSFDDYSKGISSLSVIDRGPSSKKYTIRGISSGLIETTAATVGVYIDEMPVSSVLNQPDIKLFDIERVEVLKGPQGTLYGEGSMGGTIKTITNKPDFEGFAGKIDLTWSSTNEGGTNTKLNGMLNIPLIDDVLALRLVAYNRSMSGFIDRVAQPDGQTVDMNLLLGLPAGTIPPFVFNSGPIAGEKDINDESTSGGRASLLWQASDNLTVNLSVLLQNSEFDGFPVEVGAGELETILYHDDIVDDDINLTNLTFEYDFGWASLTSSSSLYQRDLTENLDASLIGTLFAPGPTGGARITNITEDRNFSEEIRLVTTSDGPWNFIAGLFYIDKQSDFTQPVSDTTGVITGAYNTLFADVLGFVPRVANFSEALNYEIDIAETQKAAFFEANYQFTEQLTATVGIRSFKIDQVFDFVNHNYATGQLILESRPTSLTKSSESGTTTKFNLAYTASDDLLFYAQATEGFRAGGVNTQPGVPDDLIEYDSDSLWNYEVGMKSTYLDDHVSFNASLYRIDWDDIQLSLPIGFARAVINAGKAKITGVEVDISAYPTEGLEFKLSIGKLSAKLAENTPEGDDYLAGDTSLPNPGFSGDRLPGVPNLNIGLSAQYTFPVDSISADGFVNFSYTYTGNSFTTLNDNSEATHYELDSYLLGNVRAGITMDDWDFTLFVNNLTDERADILKLNAVSSNPGTLMTTRNRPRTIGLNIRMRF